MGQWQEMSDWERNSQNCKKNQGEVLNGRSFKNSLCCCHGFGYRSWSEARGQVRIPPPPWWKRVVKGSGTEMWSIGVGRKSFPRNGHGCAGQAVPTVAPCPRWSGGSDPATNNSFSCELAISISPSMRNNEPLLSCLEYKRFVVALMLAKRPRWAPEVQFYFFSMRHLGPLSCRAHHFSQNLPVNETILLMQPWVTFSFRPSRWTRLLGFHHLNDLG